MAKCGSNDMSSSKQKAVVLGLDDGVDDGDAKKEEDGAAVPESDVEPVMELEGDAVWEGEGVSVLVGVISGASQQAPRSVTQQGTSSSAPSDVTCTHAEFAAGLSPMGSFVRHSVAPSLRMKEASDDSASAEYGAPQPQPKNLLRVVDGDVADSASHTP